MHICFITSEYPKTGQPHGGIGSFVKTIAPALAANGCRVTVLGLNYSDSYEYAIQDGIHIVRLPRKRVAMLSWFLNSRKLNRELASIHKEHPIDIVETPELGLAFIKKLSGIKHVIRLHGGHHFFAEAENRKINWRKGWQEKRSFKKADAFVAVSEYVKMHTAKFLSYHGKPVALIKYPINTNFFSPQLVKSVPYRIVFAGTVCEKKGIRQLIQAMPGIIAVFPEATLHIYGRDWQFPDGRSYIDYLRSEELPKIGIVSESIFFCGAVNQQQLRDAYASAAVCVFPSHMETQGLVAPEAMAMEKAVVFTKLGPGPETIIDGETGLLCDPHNSNDIADKICWVFENPQQIHNMVKTAREAVLNQYALSKAIDLNIRLYYDLLRLKGGI